MYIHQVLLRALDVVALAAPPEEPQRLIYIYIYIYIYILA